MQILSKLEKVIFGSYIPIIIVDSSICAKTKEHFLLLPNIVRTQHVRDCVEVIDTKRAVAVALLINSPGGSPVQCDIITNILKGYTQKHKLPLYTFAEDIAASGGQYLLSIGDKSFAHETSLVGSVGVVGMWVGLGDTLRDYKIKPESFNSNAEQMMAYQNHFQHLTKEGKEKVLRHLYTHHEIFIKHTEKYSPIKLSPEERAAKIFNAQIILGKDAVEYGLVGEIGQYELVLKRDFPKASFKFTSKKSWRQKLFGGVISRIEGSPLSQILPYI